MNGASGWTGTPLIVAVTQRTRLSSPKRAAENDPQKNADHSWRTLCPKQPIGALADNDQVQDARLRLVHGQPAVKISVTPHPLAQRTPFYPAASAWCTDAYQRAAELKSYPHRTCEPHAARAPNTAATSANYVAATDRKTTSAALAKKQSLSALSRQIGPWGARVLLVANIKQTTTLDVTYKNLGDALFDLGQHTPLRYAEMLLRFRAADLEPEFHAMLHGLPRHKLKAMRNIGLRPRELLRHRAESLTERLQNTTSQKNENTEVKASHNNNVHIDAMHPLQESENTRRTEVLIIGAGAAGIAAANSLLDGGIANIVLEAQDHPLGRAYQKIIDGQPRAIGCHWLHMAHENILSGRAGALGFVTMANNKFHAVYLDGLSPSDAQTQLAASRERIEASWARAEERQQPCLASLAHKPRNALETRVLAMKAATEVGAELDQFTVQEIAGAVDEHDDRVVVGGLGSLIEADIHGLDIDTGARVARIVRHDLGVSVYCEDGRCYEAKRLILTVTPKALQHIVFDPPLPEAKADAISSFQMSRFEKIFVRFAENPFPLDVAENTRAMAQDDDGQVFELALRPFGDNAAIMLVGAQMADKLLAMSPKETQEWALSRLGHIFGDKIRHHFLDLERTAWSSDPDFGGSWGLARPTATDNVREEMARPLDDRIYFAGETLAPAPWRASVTGAVLSGQAVAADIRQTQA